MTYEQYWYGDPRMAKAYYEADKLRQERFNQEAWLMGAYVYDAIGRLTPILHAFADQKAKPIEYMPEPYPIRAAEREKKTAEQTRKQEEQEALRAKVYMLQLIEAGKNWGKNKTKK